MHMRYKTCPCLRVLYKAERNEKKKKTCPLLDTTLDLCKLILFTAVNLCFDVWEDSILELKQLFLPLLILRISQTSPMQVKRIPSFWYQPSFTSQRNDLAAEATLHCRIIRTSVRMLYNTTWPRQRIRGCGSRSLRSQQSVCSYVTSVSRSTWSMLLYCCRPICSN